MAGTLVADNVNRADGKSWGPVLDTPQTATGVETFFDFSPPTWATKITIIVDSLSLSGTAALLTQLGTGSGLEVTGYKGCGGYYQNGASSGVANYTTGFGDGTAAAANSRHGEITLRRADPSSNKWVAAGSIGLDNVATMINLGGSKVLAAALTTVRVTSSNGTDFFDVGSVNCMYE